MFGQQPSFENLKVKGSPYLQFNDIIEHNNDLFFITNEGVYQKTGKQIKIMAKKENLAKFIKVENKLYTWSIYGEFFELNETKLLPLPFNSLVSKKLNNKIINNVVYDDNTFWISTVVGGGVVKIDQAKQEVKTIVLQKEFPYYVSKLGNQFISGSNSGASKKELSIDFGQSSFPIPLAENLSSSKSNVLKLKDGTFLFSRQYEVIRFNETKIINRVFLEKNIEDIYQSNDGKIWFALNTGGVINFHNGSLNSTGSIRYLGNKTVVSITQDKKENMWFGTSGNGIYLLKKSIKLNYKSPKIFSSTNKKTEDVQSVSSPKPLPAIDENSKILRTDLSKYDTIPPSVFINNIKINGVDTITLSYFDLTHNQNSFEINISGVFGGKSELQYKYILEGQEQEWNYTTNTNMYYSSLLPGNYTFKVLAMSDSGIWSKTPGIVTFSISPPLYASFWFIFSIIFLIIAVVLTIIFVQTRKKQKRTKLFNEEKRKVLISELHALRSQMNPHFIFNTLSSIQSFITNNSSKDAVHYLSKFSKLMRATLENTQKQKIPIKDEIETLELYMDLEKLRLNNKFEYEININKNIDVQFEEIPPMLIQPYIENAIWHGISHKTTNGTIKLSFDLINESFLKCEIEDDGIGRKKAMELKKVQQKNVSLGMSITKDRLEIINSLKDSALNINIIDLKDDNKAKGTKIEIFIPLD